MGTLAKPSRFDALARALPDEPHFTLLARDPLACCLVSIWSKLRMGADIQAARAVFNRACDIATGSYWATPDVEAASEALDCAMAMAKWRAGNDGRWREPRPPAPDRRELSVVDALECALHALRSYQYGNGAPDLAEQVAGIVLGVLERATAPAGGFSAHAHRTGDWITVELLASMDEGPMKAFTPLVAAELDAPHALELLGTLALAHRELAGIPEPTPGPAPAPPEPRPGDEAIHAKLDLILEGQKTLMAQQDELNAGLQALATDIDTELAQHAADLAAAAAAKGVDLTPQIAAVNALRAKFGDAVAAVAAPADPAGAGADESAAASDTIEAGTAPADGSAASAS